MKTTIHAIRYDDLTVEQIHEFAARLPLWGETADGTLCEHERVTCVLCGHGFAIDDWARALPEPKR